MSSYALGDSRDWLSKVLIQFNQSFRHSGGVQSIFSCNDLATGIDSVSIFMYSLLVHATRTDVYPQQTMFVHLLLQQNDNIPGVLLEEATMLLWVSRGYANPIS